MHPSKRIRLDDSPDDRIYPPPSDTDWFSPSPAATTAMPGFHRASISGQDAKLFVPSDAALREAREKMRKWQEEVIDEPDSPTSTSPIPFSKVPDTPTPASLFRSANADHSSPFKSPSTGTKWQAKPFKSPLISTTPSRVSTPVVSSLRGYTAPSQSPLRQSSAVNLVTAQKALGFTPRHASATTRPKFVTPFKTIAKSATPRVSPSPTQSNPRTIVNRVYPPSVASSLAQSKRSNDARIFDLRPPPGRRTLAASGLRPQTYSAQELEDLGINIKDICQASPHTAPFYAFTTRSRFPADPPAPSPSLVLDRSAVLEELHAKGCTLARQAWVDNHWPLILWKLAGMVALDPTAENDPLRKRWCWQEVIRQFLYRYERDLNSSSRPPLRLITTRDASAESPMVLCISDIIWPAGDPEMAPVQTCPELEVTDGWYRLRARIDAPLSRAIQKGKIRIGRKIAVTGAKLLAEKKDGSEVLEAYNSNVLLLTGNSTHMAPWHAKLGFQRGPFVATLNSLTADGGNVAVMMLTVMKAYPVAYLEFVEDTDGQKRRVGPHDAKEESRLSTQWKAKRESHASRLWSEYEQRRSRLLDFAERLEQHVGSKFIPRPDDGPPDRIYDIYDTLREDIEAAKSMTTSIGRDDAGWLAQHIRERAVQERDGVSSEIEQELESICPPRDVKVFCVVVVNDSRTHKYRSKRTAQVTVWDVPGVSVPDDCTQSPFLPGQRYFVTNLIPSQASAWMDRTSGGEVYLSTRKNSKWTLVQ